MVTENVNVFCGEGGAVNHTFYRSCQLINIIVDRSARCFRCKQDKITRKGKQGGQTETVARPALSWLTDWLTVWRNKKDPTQLGEEKNFVCLTLSPRAARRGQDVKGNIREKYVLPWWRTVGPWEPSGPSAWSPLSSRWSPPPPPPPSPRPAAEPSWSWSARRGRWSWCTRPPSPRTGAPVRSVRRAWRRTRAAQESDITTGEEEVWC